MVVLQNIQINSRKILKAIMSFCPNLKEIQFFYVPGDADLLSDHLSVDQLRNLLASKKNRLSKVLKLLF